MANSTFKNILLYGASMEMLEELFRGARHGTQSHFRTGWEEYETWSSNWFPAVEHTFRNKLNYDKTTIHGLNPHTKQFTINASNFNNHIGQPGSSATLESINNERKQINPIAAHTLGEEFIKNQVANDAEIPTYWSIIQEQKFAAKPPSGKDVHMKQKTIWKLQK